MHMQRRRARKGACVGAVLNVITVMLFQNIEPGMEPFRLPAEENADIRREPRIQCIGKLIRRDARFRVKMRHLRKRMHPTVRAAGSMQRSAYAGQLKKLALNAFLYGQTVRLRLPANICRSVILNDHADALHDSPSGNTCPSSV